MSRTLWKLAFCMVLCLLLPGADRFQSQERKNEKILEVEVSEAHKLKTLLERGKIEGHLKDGTVLRGKARGLKDEWLVLNLRTTVPPKVFPRGEQSILIRDFSRIHVTRYQGNARVTAPLILGAAGLGLGLLVAATEFAGESFNATYGLVMFGFSAAGAVGGYSLGSWLDRKSTLVKIMPEKASPNTTSQER